MTKKNRKMAIGMRLNLKKVKGEKIMFIIAFTIKLEIATLKGVFDVAMKVKLDNYDVGEEIELTVIPDVEFHFDPKKNWGSYLVSYNRDDKIGINGYFSDPLVLGTEYLIQGEITLFRQRKQIKVHFCKKVFPIKKEGVKRFLKLIPGIGKTKAQAIFQTYGIESLMVLKNDPERVAEDIKSISLKQAQKIQTFLELEFEGQEIVAELMGYDIHAKSASYLFSRYKERALTMLEENPYFLIGEVNDKNGRPFSFAKSDKVAQTIGFPLDSPCRIEAGIIGVLKDALSKSHCYLTLKELLTLTERFLSSHQFPISYDMIQEVFTQLVEQEELIYEESRVYLKKVHEEETNVALKVVELTKYPFHYSEEEVTIVLDDLLASEPEVVLEEKQREAVITANRMKSGIFILNGAAGTGKTFTLKWILRVKEELRRQESRKKKEELPSIRLAPTGKAAKVMERSLKKQAQTIHRGLRYNPIEKKFEHDESNPLLVDLMMCDEFSMVDLSLSHSLLEATRTGTLLIILGDVNQLVSVGYGNVLRDLIQSGVCQMVTLEVAKRQGLLSDILKNAYRILNRLPVINYNESNDAFFIQRQTPSSIHQTIIESIQRLLRRENYTLEDIQVLSPQRTGILGTNMLNYLIQEAFNPSIDPLQQFALSFDVSTGYQTTTYDLYFKTGDKVIQIKNNYDVKYYEKSDKGTYQVIEELTEITNGECGVIEEIRMETDPENEEKEVPVVIVRYDEGYVKYFKSDLNELLHAYCLTVHKSQGSGWKAMICPIYSGHLHMLDFHLIYTAWTRSMDFALFVGHYEAMAQGVLEDKESDRRSTLAERIKKIKQLKNKK